MTPGGSRRARLGAVVVLLLVVLGGVAFREYRRRTATLAPRDLCVELSVKIAPSPPKLELSWPPVPLRHGQVLVFRKDAATPAFAEAPLVTLPAGSQHWVDADVTPGKTYDYFVQRTLLEGHWQSAGFIRAGIEVPLVEDRGQVALVIEERLLTPLSAELARLEEDLRGDGWTTVRIPVARTATPPEVKAAIVAVYKAAPERLRQVLLLGHVPVPYSGNIAPDHHFRPTPNGRTPGHRGAWAADLYYGDMVGTWSDTSVDTRQNDFPPSDHVNDNVPGDGKFDQEVATTERQAPRGALGLKLERRGQIALAVGRVDLSDLPAFAPRSELDLLRAYLSRDHRFRHAQLPAERRAVVDEHFPIFAAAKPGHEGGPETKALAGYSVASALFGPEAVKSGRWFDPQRAQPALFGYVSGPGMQTTCDEVGTTADLASKDPKVVFSVVWGSFFGDWDHTDNFLRAQLAAGTGLGTTWGSDPWFFHPLALGATLGDCTLLTQDSSPLVHLALLGDPTLRMFVVAPPTEATATAVANGVSLRWKPSPERVLGYHVYRTDDPKEAAHRLTERLLSDTTFVDARPASANTRYLVRAVKLEVTASGSFYNASQAAFAVPPVR